MKILITGGLGNIGSWITGHLLENGFEVTTFSVRDRDVLRDRKFERIFGDIENTKDLENLFSGNSWDAIIHLASIDEGNLSEFPFKALSINSFGTRNILQQLADSNKPDTHFIYFSTFHIYGAKSGIIEEDTSFPNPRNDYAATHLFAEYYVQQFNFTHRIPFTIFRLTNGYGAPKEIESSKWKLILNDLAKSALENGIVKLSSNGRPSRDFIWLGDVCDVVEKCLNQGAVNEIFNLGSGQSMSALKVAETVQQAYRDRYSKTIEIKTNESDLGKYDESLTVSIKKLQDWLEFMPQNKMHEESTAIFRLLDRD